MTTRKPFFIMPMYRGQNNKNRQQLIANKKKFIEQQIKNNVTRNLYSHSQSFSYTTFGPNYVYTPNDNNNNNNNNQNPKNPSNFWMMVASIVGLYLSTKKK